MNEQVKDRNGADLHVGDLVFFLRGTVGDTFYQTCDTVTEVLHRQRMIRVSDNDLLYWHECWKEEE